ncbi:hypothetical protein EX30DRAFT_371968 [Ascodesmis nigricans]|uniref:SAYSvFN domain-containing protein n=1 Tax=Ascodesmis nigricans TaxID=341454 RepID=A0A4S2MVQ6_9PEZI|nr:hypothetical protein EX30DRAFT_371968 [Ascodesmis nigricans]
MPPPPKGPSQKEKKEKKPFHIKKKDLDLDEYRRELADGEPGKLVTKAAGAVLYSRQFWAYVILQIASAWLGYGQAMLCIGILWMCYVNTGKRKKGEKSAYSLFNEGFEAIDGSTNMQMLDRELRRQLY